jgi:hypothetical protein
MDGERVHAAGKLGRQRAVDQAMALEPALSGERLRNDINPEVTLPAGAVAGVSLVPMGFIDHAQAFRAESLGQPSCDEVMHAHGLAYAGSRAGVNRPAGNESKPFVKLAAGGIRSA